MALSAATRRGKASRRAREFEFVAHHLRKKNLPGWLFDRCTPQINGCLLWNGTRNKAGYGRITLRMDGERITIDVHRLALILELRTAIPLGFDAGHAAGCPHRHCVKHVFKQPFAENAVTDPTGSHFGGDVD